MKASISSLNPDAESYVPVSQREGSSMQPDSTVSHERALEQLTISDDSKSEKAVSPQGNASFSDQQRKIRSEDEEFNMQMSLAYLQMCFQDTAEQCLISVYNTTGGDIDLALDMLSELESVEKPLHLPDALNIGDIPEISPSGETSAATAENVAGGSSSSGGISHLAILS